MASLKKEPLKTDLVGDKILKTDEKVEFFGQVDELSSVIMEYTHHVSDAVLKSNLIEIVSTLSIALAEIAGGKGRIGEEHLNSIIALAEEYEKRVGPFKLFVTPGKTLMGAKTHVVRTVTRRAERAYATVYEKYGTSELIFEYLNTLSKFFFALARSFDEREE